MLRNLFLVSLVGWSLAATSCGNPPNRLYGSISEVYDLSFDQVQIDRIGDSIQITYGKGANAAGGKIAKLTVYVADLTIAANNSIDLTEVVNNEPRGDIQRVVEATTDFGISVGSITFKTPPVVGATTTGSFFINTANPMGRTINGDFQAKVNQL